MSSVQTKTLWKVDPTHTEVQFKVRHMVISTVTGSFQQFDASAETEGDGFENASIRFSADIDSLSTGQTDRDNHLKSPDFFDAPSHPKLEFVSSAFTHVEGEQYALTGDLTIRGTTQPVTLDVVYGGTQTDPWGLTRAGFEVSGKISRKSYGLLWDVITEAGAVVVSDDVRLLINIELVKQG
jgi:polyisoprenoid-binding protein YceI